MFSDKRAKTAFWIFSILTFLGFLSTSTLVVLGVILREAGLNNAEIGMVLAAPTIPAICAILFSGVLLMHWRPIALATAGQLLTLLGFASFEVTSIDSNLAAGSRFVVGIGYGIFLTAALVYIRNLLVGSAASYYLGVYSSMIPLPNIVGPAIAERYLESIGRQHFFLWMSIPLVVSVFLLFVMSSGRSALPHPARSDAIAYVLLLTDKRSLLPNGCILLVGVLWGFVLSLLSLLFRERDMSIGLFMTTCTGSLLIGRFWLAKYYPRFPRELVSGSGLGAMAVSFLLLAFMEGSSAAVTISGVIFGLGYSAAFPIIGVWISDLYSESNRAKALALFNSIYHFGIYVIPLGVGLLVSDAALQNGVVALGLVALVYSLAMLSGNWRSP